MTYVALLRGINVGGKNILKMSALKVCLDGAGFEGVETFIQSGNVIFRAARSSAAALAVRIEDAIASDIGVRPPVVVVSHDRLRQILAEAPARWRRGDELRRNIAFLFPPVSAARAVTEVDVRAGVDAVEAGNGVLYLSTMLRDAGRSLLTRIVLKPIYRQMTIRTYGTCQKILALMERD